jgi:cytidylate kinase
MSEAARKKHIITIAGRPGSGKSTTAKLVAGSLGFQHFSSGDFFRQIGTEMGLDTLRANRTAETNAEIDRRVDSRLQEMGANEEKLVIDSRMAWHWMPRSYKVFLDLDLVRAAERILGSMSEERKAHEHVHDDPVEYAEALKQRLHSENLRYKSKYDVNAFDLHNYDLVVDTGQNSIEATVKLVLDGYQAWLKA